jgi:hypothetical protein
VAVGVTPTIMTEQHAGYVPMNANASSREGTELEGNYIGSTAILRAINNFLRAFYNILLNIWDMFIPQ